MRPPTPKGHDGWGRQISRTLIAMTVAWLAVGGLATFTAAESLNEFPEAFADRLLFAEDEQALATAAQTVELPETDADLERGELAGVEPMPRRQLRLEAQPGARGRVSDAKQPRFAESVRLRLSKYRYPWEDRHLDAIVWTTPEDGDDELSGSLEVRLEDEAGEVLSQQSIESLSPSGVFFSVGFVPELRGSAGTLVVIWRDGEREVGRAAAPFVVAEPADVPRSGRVPVRVLNEPGATVANAPMTVGVPFPRGALMDETNVRLVDEHGEERPLQTRVTARWSRFGPVRWLLADFTVDLDGDERKLFLEYGPEVDRTRREPMPVVEADAGFPSIDTGRLRVGDEGLHFTAIDGDEAAHAVLSEAAFFGAFVRHEDGRTFLVPEDVSHAIEETGSEKTVIRRTGWYVEPDSDEPFCQFITRFVFHRDSPVVRVFHTWIFTGDGNADRIADMGWRFATAADLEPLGMLTAFDSGEWIDGRSLVQFDHRHFNLHATDADAEPRDGRAPGVLGATVGEARVWFGAKDFWQNFPSELTFEDEAFTFFNWPRRNPPASHERPISRSDAFRHRFAHEGELLDFRLPKEYTEGPIWEQATRSGRSGEAHWAEGEPESVNAQGIARTEEMFLYVTDRQIPAAEAARLLEGLNDESVRAVADPAWVAASEALGPIHHRDRERYGEHEHIYDQVVHAPARWNERLGFYGMWLHGEVPAWSINLDDRTVSLYRALRKNHHGWPIGWVPFARSGDPQMLKYAEAATRQMIDANFCHYATAEIDEAVGPDHFRRQGWWDRSPLPWAGRDGPRLRNYTVDCDYLWHAYYLTGFTRARDVALLFGKLTQHDYQAQRGPRTTSSTLTSYLDMYEATFDPWFLAAAHDIADLHVHQHGRVHQDVIVEDRVDKLTPHSVGHFWRPADIRIHRFTGDPRFERLAYNHAVSHSSPWTYPFGGLWPRLSMPFIPQATYAYTLTDDTFYLDRAAAYLDRARMGVYDGQPEYARGSLVQGGTARGIFTGYYIRYFPLALGAFERAGYQPDPLPNPFYLSAPSIDDEQHAYAFELPEILIDKRTPGAMPLLLASHQSIEDRAYRYEIVGPDEETQMHGSWPTANDRPSQWLHSITLPEDAPVGLYHVRLSGEVAYPDDTPAERGRVRRRHGRVAVPVAPPDVPEVIAYQEDEDGVTVDGGGPEIQYWFFVPEEVNSFWIEFHGSGGLNRVSVWNGDGERVWDRSYRDNRPGRAEIHVPEKHAGQLWRATGARFTIDPQIPPYFAASRTKWFDPTGELLGAP